MTTEYRVYRKYFLRNAVLTFNTLCLYTETIITCYLKSQVWLVSAGWTFVILV